VSRVPIRPLIGFALAITAALAQEPKLAIVGASVQVVEDGAPAGDAHQFFPGETVYSSFLVSGFSKREKDDKQYLSLSHRIEVRDPIGVAVVAPATGTIADDLAPQDKNWQPKIRTSFALPPLAPKGTYKIHIAVKDEYSGATAEKVVEFNVEAREVAPSDTLIVRNFRFVRTERDDTALAVAAFRPGDTLWAKFDITGYRLAEGNRYEVSYGLEVFVEGGESVFKEPVAAEITEATFYPKRYIPGTISLTLNPDTAKGKYVLAVQVKDVLGGQEYETKHPFSIE
jgi:hypothetical protein